jgi:hypothetical protein
MTGPRIAKDPGLLVNRKTIVCQALTVGVVVCGTDFKSNRRERIYDADKIWSGEHTILDYSEI